MTRDQAKERIRSSGAKVSEFVSRNTDYLVLGKEPGRKKFEKAIKLGIKAIKEKEFLEIIKLELALRTRIGLPIFLLLSLQMALITSAVKGVAKIGTLGYLLAK